MGTLQGLIHRAVAEDGYIEKASDRDLDSKEGNKGDKNYTKYARDINNLGLMGCQAQPWCCTFQFWLEVQEFGLDDALKHWNMTKKDYVGYNCFATYNRFKTAGKTGMKPKPGAVAIFTFSHAGRVIRIYEKDGRKVWDCAEGNTSSNLNDRNGGQVKIKMREWNDPSVKGFCYIDYGIDTETTRHQPGWKRAADGKRWWYSYADGSWPSHGWAYLPSSDGAGAWYLFDAEGYMLTGYQTAPDGRHYYLCEEQGADEGKCMITDNRGVLMIGKWDDASGAYRR